MARRLAMAAAVVAAFLLPYFFYFWPHSVSVAAANAQHCAETSGIGVDACNAIYVQGFMNTWGMGLLNEVLFFCIIAFALCCLLLLVAFVLWVIGGRQLVDSVFRR